MSLVELLVGMFIFSVVISATLYIFVPLMDTMVRSNEIAEYNTLFDNVANLIVTDLAGLTAHPRANGIDLADAIEFDLSDDPITLVMNRPVIYARDADTDTITRNGNPLLPERFSGERTDINFRLRLDPDAAAAESVFLLTVSLSRRNPLTGAVNEDLTISRDYVVKPLALNQFNN